LKGDLFRSSVMILALFVLFKFSPLVSADAVVRNQSMFASTIAEIFIESDRVRIELEIGAEDVKAFKNLVPDSIYSDLTGADVPYRDRLHEFFTEQLVLSTENSSVLPGALLKIGPGKRQQRDPVTGESLAADEQTVVNAVVVYPFKGKPEYLQINNHLDTSSIGFVAYHGAVAINDFRYLGKTHAVDLDWEDPWYSMFDARALRRTYYHAMSGFLYIESYEVRKELIMRPKDLQHWIDLGLDGVDIISVDRQPDIKQKVADFLEDKLAVKIDGLAVAGELVRINFLDRTLRSSRVIAPPESLDVEAAVLGLIYTFPIDSLPDTVTMEWDMFNDRIKMVSAASVDQAGPLPITLEPDYNVLEWTNFLKNPNIPKLVDVGEVPQRWKGWLEKWRWVVILFIALVMIGLVLRVLRKSMPFAVGILVLAGIMLAGVHWFSQESRLSEDKSRQIVSRLLQNIYHAFDYRKEEKIYDILSYSVEGDLLTTIYLETRKGLLLANQGGARTKVKEISVNEVESTALGEGKVNTRVTWEVTGTVGHWGHVHTRKNLYRAELLLSPASGNWKIEDLEILEEQRVN
jgi:hypothetical protein